MEKNVEINTEGVTSGYSHYFEETVDFTSSSGKIKLRYGDAVTTNEDVVYYLQSIQESFTIKENRCAVKVAENIKDAYNRENVFADVFLPEAETADWKVKGTFENYLGPSAILDIGFRNKEQFKYVGDKPLRGYSKTNKFQACIKIKDRVDTVNFYFADQSQAVGTLPLRVDVYSQVGKTQRTYTYTFAQFKLLRTRPSITIPTGYGCVELNPQEDAPALPELFLDRDFAMKLEVAMVSLEDGKETAFSTAGVYDAEIVYSKDDQLLALKQSKLNLEQGMASNDRLRFQTNQVVDLDEAVIYETDMTTSECSFKSLDTTLKEATGSRAENMWDYMPPFEFAGKASFKILDSDLWFIGKDSILQYLGKSTVRGYPVVTYETTFDDKFKGEDGEPRTVVVTRHFLDKDVAYDAPVMIKGAPVQTTVNVYNKAVAEGVALNKIEKTITISVHSFDAKLLEPLVKPKAFDVSNCFNSDTTSRWLRFNFPATDMERLELADYIPAIETAFRETLRDIGPLRLPTVLVDFNLDEVTVTAKILARPPFEMTFEATGKTHIVTQGEKSATEQRTLTDTPDQCAKVCEAYDGCNAFSFCNSLECTIWSPVSGDDKIKTEALDGCTLFGRAMPYVAGSGTPLGKMLIDAIFAQLDSQVKANTFQLNIPAKGQGGVSDVVLSASSVDADVEPGWLANQARKGKISMIDYLRENRKYIVYKEKSRILPEGLDGKAIAGLTQLKKVNFRVCMMECNDDTECGMMSFCRAVGSDGLGDCVLSTLSTARVNEANATETDNNCNILKKRDLTSFEISSSYSLNVQAQKMVASNSNEECATLCLEEKDFKCRSFDYCIDSNATVITNYCLFHEYHVSANANQKLAETTKGSDIKFTMSKESTCYHHSRKFSDDYARTRGVTLSKTTDSFFQSNDMSLEQCAHQCSENSDGVCQSFQFCDTITADKRLVRLCYLSTDREAAKKGDKDNACSIYTKSYADLWSPPETGSIWKSKFASSGVSWFVGFLFLACGGALGFFLYKYKIAK
ncbi:hypothetical protein HDE_14242 [Halotydeus destructor]|nr:hypothetical protein HDE_14242 [Halotydeus destructor]